MKFFVVLCVILEAALAAPIEPGYGVPLAPPLQTVTIPEGPAILSAPATTIRVVAGPQTQVFAHAPVLAQNQFIHQAPVFAQAPVTQVFQTAAPQFIRTVAGPVVQEVAPLAAAPVVAAATIPVVGASSVQHHSQDEFGSFNYGYQDINSAKEEVHSADGITRGSYSYVDANGLLQRVDYIADPINGFRVAGTNIPVAHGPAAPVAIADTPEVVAARAEFQRAFDAAELAAAIAPEDVPVPTEE